MPELSAFNTEPAEVGDEIVPYDVPVEIGFGKHGKGFAVVATTEST